MDILRESLTPEEFTQFETAYQIDVMRWPISSQNEDFIIRSAVEMDRPKVVRILFEAGIRLDLVEGDVILFKVKSGEMLRLLLSNGPNGVPIEVDDENETPLFDYVQGDYPSAVEEAIKAGMDVNHNGDYGRPLYLAKSIEVAKILLENGASRLETDRHGRTPAQHLRYFGWHDVADYIDAYQDLPDTKGALLEDIM